MYTQPNACHLTGAVRPLCFEGDSAVAGDYAVTDVGRSSCAAHGSGVSLSLPATGPPSLGFFFSPLPGAEIKGEESCEFQDANSGGVGVWERGRKRETIKPGV